jgi:hypothetical protein
MNTRLILLLVSLLATGTGFADEPPFLSDQWCDEPQYDPAAPLAYETLSDDARQLIAAGRWKEADRAIVQRFSARTRSLRESSDAADREKLDEVFMAISSYLAADTQQFARWQNLTPGEEALEFELPLQPVPGEGSQSAFIVLPCSSLDEEPIDEAIAYLAYTLYRAGRSGWDIAADIARIKVEDVYLTHRNRLFNGLPMWPWETFLNGLRIRPDSGEPQAASRTQLIVLRPDVSPALRFAGTENSQVDMAVLVEPFGFIRYRNIDYSKWWGFSAAISMTNDNGIGYGVLGRWNNYFVGAGYHDRHDDVMIYLGYDLYELLQDESGKLKDSDEILDDLVQHIQCREGKSADCPQLQD